jgi:hypothetical protein
VGEDEGRWESDLKGAALRSHREDKTGIGADIDTDTDRKSQSSILSMRTHLVS